MTFQCLMDIVLRPHHQFVASYMDKVIIHSSTWAAHLYHPREVLRSFWKARLMANPKKCHLGLMHSTWGTALAGGC